MSDLTICFAEEAGPVVRKNSRAARMFWTWENYQTEKHEQLDAKILQQDRKLHVLECRITEQGHLLTILARYIFQGNKEIRFVCIACRYEFSLPSRQADELNFTITCPKGCGGWAFPIPLGEPTHGLLAGEMEVVRESERYRTTAMAAKEIGCCIDWVRKKAREHELGKPFRQSGKLNRTTLYFVPEDFAKLKELHANIRYGPRPKLFDSHRQVG